MGQTFKVVVEHDGFTHGGNRQEGASGPEDRLTLREIASSFRLQERHFRRYIALLRLIQPLQQLVTQQKIGVKAGAILAQLSPHDQQRVFDSITPEAFQAEYRLTENEAKNFAAVFRSGNTETSDDAGIAELGGLFGQPDGNERSFETQPQLGERTSITELMSDPDRQRYFEQATQVDFAHAVSADDKEAIREATRDVTRMVARIGNEDGRIRFAQNPLEGKQLMSMRKIVVELVPLRAVVGDDLNEENAQMWEELAQHLSRLAEKVRAVTGA